MHFHRMLIFWLAGLARSLGCGSEGAVADHADGGRDQQLIAAHSSSWDAGAPSEPAAPPP